jgi:hypothetical protein
VSHPDQPLLRVVHGGTPTAAELAALVTAVAASRRPETREAARRSRWLDREALLRRPLLPGPGAWKRA